MAARVNGRAGVAGYFFGPRRREIPTAEDTRGLSAGEAILVGRFGDVGLLDGTWPVLPRTTDWDCDAWPMPVFGSVFGGAASRREYDESTFHLLSVGPVSTEEARHLPKDYAYGYVASPHWRSVMHRRLHGVFPADWLLRQRRHLPLLLGWSLVDALVMWAIVRTTSGDLARLAGVVLIWLLNVSLSVWYADALFGPRSGRLSKASFARQLVAELYWPVLIAFLIAPGLWVGLAARSPLWVAALALLVMEVPGLVIHVADPVRRSEPLAVEPELRLFGERAIIMLSATLVGMGLRVLLRL